MAGRMTVVVTPSERVTVVSSCAEPMAAATAETRSCVVFISADWGWSRLGLCGGGDGLWCRGGSETRLKKDRANEGEVLERVLWFETEDWSERSLRRSEGLR